MMEEKWYLIYKDYWGDEKYCDTFVRNAFASTTMEDLMKGELIKKGTAYQCIWMYVLHEYEDAIMDCKSGNIFDNDAVTPGDSPHAWDEGWAFYAGSLEGTGETIGTGGASLMNLAQKRCADFGTCCANEDCSETNTDSSMVAKATQMKLAHAESGRDKILISECDKVAEDFHAMVDQMTVPLIQGMLKYAYKSDPNNPQGSCTDGVCPKAWGEGWAFAAAVLPRLDECDPDVAEKVRANLDVANDKPMSQNGFADLKAAVEGTYECLGLTCEDIGTYQTSAGPYPGMESCAGPSDADGGAGGALAPIAGYLPATDVVPHSMIDLDQQEISSAAGEGTDAGFDEAIRVYQQGGGGTCTASDVADEAINQCNAVGDPKGNSVKGSGAIRTIEGFATSGPTKMMEEPTYITYKDYWGDEKYCDTFVMNVSA